jgi:hypothetical protein
MWLVNKKHNTGSLELEQMVNVPKSKPLLAISYEVVLVHP